MRHSENEIRSFYESLSHCKVYLCSNGRPFVQKFYCTIEPLHDSRLSYTKKGAYKESANNLASVGDLEHAEPRKQIFNMNLCKVNNPKRKHLV